MSRETVSKPQNVWTIRRPTTWQALKAKKATGNRRKELVAIQMALDARTYCSLNAILAQSKICPFGVNATIELKNIIHPTIKTSSKVRLK
jgi:hypothetical protein